MDYGKNQGRFIRYTTGAIYYRQSEGDSHPILKAARLTNVGMKRLNSEEWQSIEDQELADKYDSLIKETCHGKP